jgi:hypothetical protein
LLPAEDRVPQAERVAVVSNRLWKSQLAEASDVIRRHLEIAGKDYVVVGVEPEGFTGIDRLNVDVWVPIGAIGGDVHGAGWHDSANSSWVQLVARLDEDPTPQLAETQSTAAYWSVVQEWRQRWREVVAHGEIVLRGEPGARAPQHGPTTRRSLPGQPAVPSSQQPQQSHVHRARRQTHGTRHSPHGASARNPGRRSLRAVSRWHAP